MRSCSSVAQSAERVAVKIGVTLSDKRRYSDRREYLIEAVFCCHREVHSGLQLPREIVVEKSGELKEACLPYGTENGNPEPSPDRAESVREGAETRARARTLSHAWGKRPTPSLRLTEAGDEIVQAQKKFWGTCNH
jgi:hypothetical protein